jgi:hypothetical protein
MTSCPKCKFSTTGSKLSFQIEILINKQKQKRKPRPRSKKNVQFHINNSDCQGHWIEDEICCCEDSENDDYSECGDECNGDEYSENIICTDCHEVFQVGAMSLEVEHCCC